MPGSAFAFTVRADVGIGPYSILPPLFVGGGVPDAPSYSIPASTVAPHERQRRKMDRRYVIHSEKNHAPRMRGRRWQIRNRNSVRGFLNRRFKWRFWGAIRALPVADEAR